jgi:uncharacterized protein (DUF2147 family)
VPVATSCSFGYPEVVPRFGVTALAACIVLVALTVAGASGATDPIVGKWRVTRGGKGVVTIAPRAGALAITATNGVKLGCLVAFKDDLVGFVDLPTKTRLKPGHYNGNLGTAGQGCYYNVALTLLRKTLAGKVTYSENDEVGGPFAFAKVSNATR